MAWAERLPNALPGEHGGRPHVLRESMDVLWLGYDGVSVRYADVSAVLLYHPSLNRRVMAEYGRVPANIRAVVVTSAGAFLPSSLSIEQLRGRLARWRNASPAH